MDYTQEQLRNAQGDYEKRGFFEKLTDWAGFTNTGNNNDSGKKTGKAALQGLGQVGGIIASSDPSGTDTNASMTGGALQGAAAGMAAGPVGAIVGGLLGGVQGVMGANAAKAAADKQNKLRALDNKMKIEAEKANNIREILSKTASNMRLSSSRL